VRLGSDPIPDGLVGPNKQPVSFIRILDSTPTTLSFDRIIAELETPLGGFSFQEDRNGSFKQRVEDITFPFREIEVHEHPSEGILPIEEAIRPPWISAEYSNLNIGQQIHEPLLGCRSVIDAVSDVPEEGYAIVSIEQAVDALVYRHSRIAEGATDAAGHVYSRTYRPVATLPEMLGSEKSPGFHYYAYGPYQNLEGLGLSGVEMSSRGHPESVKVVDATLDPRKERRERVLSYQAELLANRGLRG
jgi:hypothetical protein